MQKTDLPAVFTDMWQFFLRYKKEIFFFCVIFYLPLYIPIHLLTPETIPGETPQFSAVKMGPVLVLRLLSAFVYLYASVAAVLLAKAFKNNEEVNLKQLLTDARAYYGKAFVSGLLNLILLILLFLAFVVPGIIFSIFWVFLIPAVVLRGKVGADALSCSKELVRGRWWKTFGYSVTISVITFAVAFTPFFILGVFLGMLQNVVSLPFLTNLLNIAADTADSFMQIISMAGLTFIFFQWEAAKSEIEK